MTPDRHSAEASRKATETVWLAIEREFGLVSVTEAGRDASVAALCDEREGALVFPGFQFDEHGEVLPAVRDLLALQESSTWSAASLILWCVAPNGYLAGQRPVDLMRSDPDAVVRAGRFAMDPTPPA